MNIEQLTELFKWMSIINIALLILSSVIIMILKSVLAKYHSKLFGVKEESVTLMTYGYLGLFKVLIIVFNLVPYTVLLFIK